MMVRNRVVFLYVVTKTGNDHKTQQTPSKGSQTSTKQAQITSKQPQSTKKRPQTTTKYHRSQTNNYKLQENKRKWPSLHIKPIPAPGYYKKHSCFEK